jgi:hypothetical protein
MRYVTTTAAAAAIALWAVSIRAVPMATAQEPGETRFPEADVFVVTPPEEMTEAIRAVFPESYSQFMTVSYERQDAGTGRKPEIWPKDATFLVPAAAYDDTIAGQLDDRLAGLVSRVLRPGDAHCEQVSVGDIEDYGWMAWPDKTVRKITVTFNVAC